MSMKFRFLNKTITNARYDYTPRYYDERKEQLNKKKELYQKVDSGELSAEERRSMLRSNFRSEYGRSEMRKNQQKTSNMRVLVLIVLILALGYFVFNGVDEVDTIVNNLW